MKKTGETRARHFLRTNEKSLSEKPLFWWYPA